MHENTSFRGFGVFTIPISIAVWEVEDFKNSETAIRRVGHTGIVSVHAHASLCTSTRAEEAEKGTIGACHAFSSHGVVRGNLLDH